MEAMKVIEKVVLWSSMMVYWGGTEEEWVDEAEGTFSKDSDDYLHFQEDADMLYRHILYFIENWKFSTSYEELRNAVQNDSSS